MGTVDTSTLTTINMDQEGTWTEVTCSGFAGVLDYSFGAGDPCKFASGTQYTHDGTSNCYECIGFSRTEVRTLKMGTTTVYVKILLNFDEQGGTSVSNKYTYYGGSRTYGSLPTTTRSGYDFNGWFDASSGGNQILSTTVVSTTSLSQTLFAQWTAQQSNEFVYISYSSSSHSSADYAYSCSACNGITSSLNFLNANYDPDDYNIGDTIEVLDGTSTYILFQVQ